MLQELLKEKYSFSKCPDTWIFSVVIIISILWRFINIPWDTAGLLFQTAISVMWLAYFIKTHSAMSFGSPILMRATVLPLGCILLFGSIYFAPQSFFYIVLIAWGFMLLSLLFSFSVEFLGMMVSMILFLFLLGFSVYFGIKYFNSFDGRELYGIKHIMTVYKLRNLDESLVASIEFTCLSDTEDRPSPHLKLNSQEKISKVITALRKTTPFSPNHESIHNPRQVRIGLSSGEEFNFKLGEGSRNNPETAWIEFEVERYQNAQLYQVIKTDLGLPVWAKCNN